MFYHLEPSKIVEHDGLVLNSINLIEGPQGSGKSYLMEQLIDKNRGFFDEVFRVAPSRTLTDHDVHSPEELSDWILRCDEEAARRKQDLKAVNQFVQTLKRPDLGIKLNRLLPTTLTRYRTIKDLLRTPRRLVAPPPRHN